jgi:Secretion system C-terminal sorting domain/SprB repeat
MKKIYTFILLLASAGLAQSQCSVSIASSTNVTCYGLCNGSATLSSVGTPNFTYLWYPGGQTVANPTDLCVGTNTVVMTDGSSCTAAAAVTITEPSQLSATSTQTNITACAPACSGSATVTPSGGTAPFSHSWNTSPVQNTATAVGLCGATFTDIITDANGCSITQTVTIEQAAALNNAINITSTSSAVMCDGGAQSNISGGNAPYTYLWSPGGQTTSSISGQCPGNYFSVCVTDADGCEICDSFTISASPTNNIVEIEVENSFSVFPNPSNGKFSVRLSAEFLNSSMILVNVMGEQIFSSTTTTSQVDLDFPGIQQGIYFLKTQKGEKSSTKRIVIDR